jgi:phospholipid/cholesterol/gamma-HCH transport system ATP-binding protein
MIELKGIKKQFGERVILDGVDLSVTRGETHVILGRSGTGKSVTLKIISGLLRQDAGSVWIDGVELDPRRKDEYREAQSKVQMLFQQAALFDSLSVAQNVAFHATEHNLIPLRQAESFAEEWLELVDLKDTGRKFPSELSGGMRKRVGLARALAARPSVMLYDEPTTGLDPVTCQVINELIRTTQKRFGVTSIVVTHDLRSAQDVGDRCSFLLDGKILETTTPLKLSSSPHEIVRSFILNAAVTV